MNNDRDCDHALSIIDENELLHKKLAIAMDFVNEIAGGNVHCSECAEKANLAEAIIKDIQEVK